MADVPATLKQIEQHFDGAQTDRLDGLIVQLDDGAWFNLRPSNAAPLLRLNVEASDRDHGSNPRRRPGTGTAVTITRLRS